MASSFICILTHGTDARFVYLSPTFDQVIGHAGLELIGNSVALLTPNYDTVAPILDCLMELQTFGTIIYNNVKTRSGYVTLETVFYCCEGLYVTTNRTISSGDFVRSNLLENIVMIDNKEVRVRGCSEVLHTKEDIFRALSQSTPPYPRKSPRVCLILDRFSEFLPIIYATESSEQVLGFKPSQLIGTSFFSYVDPDELYEVQEEFMDMKIGQFRTLTSLDGIVAVLSPISPFEFFEHGGFPLF
ncbi:hypothetical protein K493DRAFT_353339 [Basidiobolus meristosporus CBS 931.73]|uniref:PAS domain-containing protein n=1 Tax=Basidiobolus meristosporus CBS 931.73 TaxID=1314790 RepID=A0A1Y1Y6C4_9FUNG|nr:hypothetical protein K493DRAFT_353339 [Basidiobolus meristosporus CBS 931.73]|eukprot:ORX93543.1 hypothetical protein K493DRAFT_353339 [Basidiobolus meristosporus CBS 931.73]